MGLHLNIYYDWVPVGAGTFYVADKLAQEIFCDILVCDLSPPTFMLPKKSSHKGLAWAVDAAWIPITHKTFISNWM